MFVNRTYPPHVKNQNGWNKFCGIMKIILLCLGFASIVVNICVNGKPWSILVCFGIYAIWSLILSPRLVEHNRIAEFTKLFILVILLLGIIEIFFVEGWAIFVIPIVMFGAITVIMILFFSNFSRQKDNVFQFLFFLIVSIIFSIIALCSDKVEIKWVFIVLLSEAGGFFVVLCAILKKKIFLEFKKRFTLK